jgi:hypothetical protein
MADWLSERRRPNGATLDDDEGGLTAGPHRRMLRRVQDELRLRSLDDEVKKYPTRGSGFFN